MPLWNNRGHERGSKVRVVKELLVESEQLDRIEHMLKQLLHHHQHPHLIGGELVFVVKDDHPAEGYAVENITVEDSEGNVIPDAQLTYVHESSDPAVLAVTQDPSDPKRGSILFGSPGNAALDVKIMSADGATQFGALGAQFTVTTGDPSQIAGGDIKFDTLTEV